MHILALNPFHTGSHQAFLEGWQKNSRHEFTVLTLPGTHWKWRMRHAATSFALQIREVIAAGGHRPDVIFTTDMLNLAELQGLLPDKMRSIPTVLYFHENQFEYPTQRRSDEAKRDFHFAFTNFISLFAADQIWFNSKFHRENLFDHASNALKKMPKLLMEDQQRWNQMLDLAMEKSRVHSPGVDASPSGNSTDGPLRIVWVGRWEHDKNPEQFFDGLKRLHKKGGDFRLSVLGESYRQSPVCFEKAKAEFADEILHWGYADSRAEYQDILRQSDVVVSTAVHEFFGIAIIEAMNAGCIPLLPDRLAYPELVQKDASFLYDGTTADFIQKLQQFSDWKQNDRSQIVSRQKVAVRLSQRFEWPSIINGMDNDIDTLLTPNDDL